MKVIANRNTARRIITLIVLGVAVVMGLALKPFDVFQTQAPPPVPDAAVTLTFGATVDGAMNTIQLGGTNGNDTVRAYNTRRAQIKSEIVARVSAYLGFDLSVTFPYHQGTNAGKAVQDPPAIPIP